MKEFNLTGNTRPILAGLRCAQEAAQATPQRPAITIQAGSRLGMTPPASAPVVVSTPEVSVPPL